jgi:hypothetical protein
LRWPKPLPLGMRWISERPLNKGVRFEAGCTTRREPDNEGRFGFDTLAKAGTGGNLASSAPSPWAVPPQRFNIADGRREASGACDYGPGWLSL